jgi:predicted membrane protein
MDVFLICFVVITPVLSILFFVIGFSVGVRYISEKYLSEQKQHKLRNKQTILEQVTIEPRAYSEPRMDSRDIYYDDNFEQETQEQVPQKQKKSTKPKKSKPPEIKDKRKRESELYYIDTK